MLETNQSQRRPWFLREGVLHTIVDYTKIRMILKIVAHSWQLDFCWNIKLVQNIRITDARKLKNLRSMDSPSGEDDLP